MKWVTEDYNCTNHLTKEVIPEALNGGHSFY